MKNKTGVWIAVIAIFAVVIGALGASYLSGDDLSTVGNNVITDPETGESIGPWTDKIVYYKLLTKDKFNGSNVGATAKVFSEEPTDWLNPRGDFSDSSLYDSFTASSGTVTVNTLTPGKYYAVLSATGYNTEFVEFVIPDGSGRSEDLPDYQAQPDIEAVKMSLVGATTDEDFAFTLTNQTAKTTKDTILLTLDENTEFKGWKVIVNDEEGFSLDTDGDGTYDEGVSIFEVSVGTETHKVFEPARGVDKFDSNDEFTFMLDDVVADENTLAISVEIKADTGDYTGANDEVWGEGEGVLSYIKIYDAEGNLFATTDVTA